VVAQSFISFVSIGRPVGLAGGPTRYIGSEFSIHNSTEDAVMKRISGKLTYANVMATVAVFLALGGAAYAAAKLPKNSVGTKQIKNSAVTAAKIKKGTITGAKVKSGSLTGTQVNAATLGTVPTAQNASTAQTANTLAAPEAWHEVGSPGQPEFLNSWVNTSGIIHGEPVAFYKDHEGVVHLRGAAMSGTALEPIFHLPPGFRPAGSSVIRVPVACSGPAGTDCEKGASSIAIVGSNFPIPADEGEGLSPAGATSVFLDGITFRAGS
jgi:hypothetical protein